MSIINDALKKVQQGLDNNTPANPFADTAPAAEPVAQPSQPVTSTSTKAVVKNKIKSISVLIVATAITLASAIYIWQQVQIAAPYAQQSLSKLVHQTTKKTDIKAKQPEQLKPMAQLTITPTGESTQQTPPLNIHGIMANASGNLVLINNNVYQEGDVINGVTILKINLDSITISNNGKEETIFMKN